MQPISENRDSALLLATSNVSLVNDSEQTIACTAATAVRAAQSTMTHRAKIPDKRQVQYEPAGLLTTQHAETGAHSSHENSQIVFKASPCKQNPPDYNPLCRSLHKPGTCNFYSNLRASYFVLRLVPGLNIDTRESQRHGERTRCGPYSQRSLGHTVSSSSVDLAPPTSPTQQNIMSRSHKRLLCLRRVAFRRKRGNKQRGRGPRP